MTTLAWGPRQDSFESGPASFKPCRGLTWELGFQAETWELGFQAETRELPHEVLLDLSDASTAPSLPTEKLGSSSASWFESRMTLQRSLRTVAEQLKWD